MKQKQSSNYERKTQEWFIKRINQMLDVLKPNSNIKEKFFVKCNNQANYYFQLQEHHCYQFFDEVVEVVSDEPDKIQSSLEEDIKI